MTESTPYAVDYLHDGARRHTVVMSPHGAGAKQHVLAGHPGATVLSVKPVRPSIERATDRLAHDLDKIYTVLP